MRDAADGRLIPGLKVQLTLVMQNGEEIGTHEMPLLCTPIYHYGRNWRVPGDGS